MRLSLRFLIPLLLALTAFAWGAVPLVDALTKQWFTRDIDTRASVIAATVQEPLAALIDSNSTSRITTFFNRMIQDERLYAVGLCLPNSTNPIGTFTFPAEINCSKLDPSDAPGRLTNTAHGLVHVSVRDV